MDIVRYNSVTFPGELVLMNYTCRPTNTRGPGPDGIDPSLFTGLVQYLVRVRLHLLLQDTEALCSIVFGILGNV